MAAKMKQTCTLVATYILTLIPRATFVVAYLLTLIPRATTECHFPDYMQTFGKGPSWFIRYEGGLTEDITVKQSYMFVTECRHGLYDGCHEYERHCKREYGNQKFLVKKVTRHLSANHEFNYECIQFVLRSKSVVQLKTSYVEKDHTESMCADTMLQMNMYPMISSEHSRESTACPFSGGYDFQMYTSANTAMALCDDIFLPMRVETDCLRGEGMQFYFRRLNCVSEAIGRDFDEPTHLRCLAKWTHRNYAFSVVKREGEANYWCIRVSFRHKIPHEMIIFFSGMCATDPHSYKNSLILRHFVSHFVKGICDDEAPMCTYEQTCSTKAREHCKLTCSLCQPEQEERPCSFEHMFHGNWHSLQYPTTTAIQIWNNTLTEGDSDYVWHCVASKDARTISRRVLKLVFPNGCFPRYMCLHIELPAKSVLRYRTGTQIPWPIKSLDEVCQKHYFDFQPETSRLTNITRTSRPWQYYISNRPTYVSCNMPWYIPKISPFVMYDSSNSEAHKGCLINSAPASAHILKLLYIHKKKVWRKHVFECLASLKNIGENDLLITQNVDQGQYMCWTFTRDHHNVYIYIYNASDCGNGTYMQLIHSYTALVTLVIRQDSSACDFIDDEQRASILRRSEENVASIYNNCQRIPWGHLTISALLLVSFRLVL